VQRTSEIARKSQNENGIYPNVGRNLDDPKKQNCSVRRKRAGFLSGPGSGDGGGDQACRPSGRDRERLDSSARLLEVCLRRRIPERRSVTVFATSGCGDRH
jgi:hypothetical protein